MYTQQVGAQAEHLARTHLEQQGLTFITSNFSCRYGEVDLIMRDGSIIVFVEVRYRQRQDYGGALESVDFRKQQKLIRTATFYLQQLGQLDTFARIDVVAISGQAPVRPTTGNTGQQDGTTGQSGYQPADTNGWTVEWIRSAVEVT